VSKDDEDSQDLYQVRDQLRSVDQLLRRLGETTLQGVERRATLTAAIEQLQRDVKLKADKDVSDVVARKVSALYGSLHSTNNTDPGILVRLTRLEEAARFQHAEPKTGEFKALAETNKGLMSIMQNVAEKGIVPILAAVGAYLAARFGIGG